MTGKLKSFLIFGIFVSGFTLLLVSPANVHGLTVLVSHGGNGDLELCLKSEGYKNACSDFNLSEYGSPFRYILDVDDPDEGHNFDICYDVKDTDLEDCRDFEFSGSSQQTVNIEIPGTGSLTEGSGTNNDGDFSLRNSEESSPGSLDTDTSVSRHFVDPSLSTEPKLPSLPPLPPLPPTPP